MSDTAEDFIPLPGSDNATLDAMFIAPPKMFRGKKLSPYSEGARILLGTAASGPLGSRHWLMIMVYVLIELEASFERYKKGEPPKVPGLGDDDATDAATADILRAIGDDLPAFQAKVIGWAGRLGKKGINEALELANAIFEEAKSTELMPIEEAAVEAGK